VCNTLRLFKNTSIRCQKHLCWNEAISSDPETYLLSDIDSIAFGPGKWQQVYVNIEGKLEHLLHSAYILPLQVHYRYLMIHV
jgi:hypothetical protein